MFAESGPSPPVSSSTSPGAATGKAEHFKFPDALRGLASLWVVLYHLTISATLPTVAAGGAVGLLWNTVFGYGGLGVAVFFVLSGFVIAHSLRRWLDGGVQLGNYLIRRVIRLSPPYWAAIVFALVIHGLAARVNHEPFAPGGAPLTGPRVLSHAVYLEGLVGHHYINDVFWTLTLEMQFYLVLGLFLAGVGRFAPNRPRLFTGSTATLAALALVGARSGLASHVTFIPLFYSFLLGALVYWVWIGRVHRAVLVANLVALGGLFAFRTDAFLATSALTGVALLVAAHTRSLGTWLAARPFQFLGRISYSLYLVHVPVLGAVVLAVVKVAGTGPAAVVAASALAMAASIAASAVFWWAVEKPSTRWSAAMKQPVRPRLEASLPTAQSIPEFQPATGAAPHLAS